MIVDHRRAPTHGAGRRIEPETVDPSAVVRPDVTSMLTSLVDALETTRPITVGTVAYVPKFSTARWTGRSCAGRGQAYGADRSNILVGPFSLHAVSYGRTSHTPPIVHPSRPGASMQKASKA
ncbi:hypothetical protein ACIPWE_20180 [Streptomyces sp. NPDC090073]|uniref:hypothetical protein n=1 Tax=Streptomyces sp. NPDC090073 TaxID=3365936 RepID=UPI0037FA7831